MSRDDSAGRSHIQRLVIVPFKECKKSNIWEKT